VRGLGGGSTQTPTTATMQPGGVNPFIRPISPNPVTPTTPPVAGGSAWSGYDTGPGNPYWDGTLAGYGTTSGGGGRGGTTPRPVNISNPFVPDDINR
jgi:hypothetical protein